MKTAVGLRNEPGESRRGTCIGSAGPTRTLGHHFGNGKANKTIEWRYAETPNDGDPDKPRIIDTRVRAG